MSEDNYEMAMDHLKDQAYFVEQDAGKSIGLPTNEHAYIQAEVDALKAEITPLQSALKMALQRIENLQTEIKAERAAALMLATEHHQVWITKDTGGLVEAYGACSCGGLKADGVTIWDILWRDHVLSLIPADSQSALDRIVAQAVLEESEWYNTHGGDDYLDIRVARLAANRAAVENKTVRQKESV